MEQVQVSRHEGSVYLWIAILNSIAAILAFDIYQQFLFIIISVSCWIGYFMKRNKGKIKLNNEGFFEDDKLLFGWESVKSLHKHTNFSIKLMMSDGSIKKINIFDLNFPSRNKIINFMKEEIGIIS